MKKEVISEKLPKAVGPYSQAIIIGELIFCSGQIGIDPETNLFVEGGIKEQTKQVLENIKILLTAAGSDLSRIIKTTVYLASMNDFPQMNEIYGSYFTKPYPARATVQVARLPKDALIEIECIAYKNCSPSHKTLEDEGGCCSNCNKD